MTKTRVLSYTQPLNSTKNLFFLNFSIPGLDSFPLLNSVLWLKNTKKKWGRNEFEKSVLFVIASYSAIAFPLFSLFAEESTRISSLTIPRVDLKIRSLNVSQRGTDVHYYLEAPLEPRCCPIRSMGLREFSPFCQGVLLGGWK